MCNDKVSSENLAEMVSFNKMFLSRFLFAQTHFFVANEINLHFVSSSLFFLIQSINLDDVVSLTQLHPMVGQC